MQSSSWSSAHRRRTVTTMSNEGDHECIGGCGTKMAYPGDRCPACWAHLRELAPIWKDAAENINPISIMRDAREDAPYKPKSRATTKRGRERRSTQDAPPVDRDQLPSPTCPTCGNPRKRGNLYCAQHAKA